MGEKFQVQVRCQRLPAPENIERANKSGPELVQQGDWVTATWREGNKIYMLAMEGSRDQLWTYLL
jgi:hypothetical protein